MNNSNTAERQARPNSASKRFIYDPSSMLLPHEKFGREQAQLDKLKHLGPKNEAPAPVPILRAAPGAPALTPATRSPDQDSGSQTSFPESHPPPYSEVPARGDPSLHDRPENGQGQAGGSASGSNDRSCRFEPEAGGARRGSMVPSATTIFEDEQEMTRMQGQEREADDGTTESPALLSDWEVVETLGEFYRVRRFPLISSSHPCNRVLNRDWYFRKSPARPPTSTLSIELLPSHLPCPQVRSLGSRGTYTGRDGLRGRSATTLCHEGLGEERDRQAQTGRAYQFRTDDLGEGSASVLGRAVSVTGESSGSTVWIAC